VNQQPLFEQHELIPVHNGPVSLNGTTPFWLLAVLLLLMMLVVFVRIFYRKNVSELMAALFSLSVTNQLVRDDNILLQRTSLLLTVIFNLSAALLLWQFGATLSSKLPFAHTDFTRFLVFAFLIAIIYSLKYLMLRLTGFVFGTEEETDAYIFNIFLSNNFFGMVLFPVVVLLFLYPQLRDSSLIGTGILATATIVFIYRILRGILIGRASSSYSAVYLFFYLCALEIAPLLVLLKVVTE